MTPDERTILQRVCDEHIADARKRLDYIRSFCRRDDAIGALYDIEHVAVSLDGAYLDIRNALLADEMARTAPSDPPGSIQTDDDPDNWYEPPSRDDAPPDYGPPGSGAVIVEYD